MKTSSSIAVVGSLNIDYLAAVDRLPGPGQTVAATGLVQRFGGKGANQAVAAVRQGARVSLIGCVGSDENGRSYADRLQTENIDCSGLCQTTKALTGIALIAVEKHGENTIIVAAGANGHLKPSHVRARAGLIRSAGAVLAQLEVPLESVVAAFQIANRAKIPCLLNLSPFRKDIPWSEFELDSLILNEWEARALLGGLEERQVFKVMRAHRIAHVLVTRGASPSLCFHQDQALQVPTLQVQPVDTVGAGDAFAGTYAAYRAEGVDFETAVRRANAAGSMATLKAGAQESMPSRRITIQKANAVGTRFTASP